MPTTNFKVFNEANTEARTFNDSEYEEATQRLNGVTPGMAISRLHNKLYLQSTAMAKAMADAIVANGDDCMDDDIPGISASINKLIDDRAKAVGALNILQRNTAYAVGDIAYSPNLPSWARLECVTAGTTGDTEPIWSSISAGGVLLSDGSVLWIVDDMRDCTPVGAVRQSLYLPAGYVKANGATVDRADYPRLVRFATENNLWTSDTVNNAGLFGVGDGTTTMVLPNWVDRMAQFSSDAGASVAAGLPNVEGTIQVPASGWTGAFYDAPKAGVVGGSSVSNYGNVHFDASYSNSIYGNSTTVQPSAIKVLPVLRY